MGRRGAGRVTKFGLLKAIRVPRGSKKSLRFLHHNVLFWNSRPMLEVELFLQNFPVIELFRTAQLAANECQATNARRSDTSYMIYVQKHLIPANPSQCEEKSKGFKTI